MGRNLMIYSIDNNCENSEINKYSSEYYQDVKWEWHRVWEYHKEADNLYHRSFNFILVAESMLIVSFAIKLAASIKSSSMVILPI